MAKTKAQQWWQFVEAEKPPDSLPTPECFNDEEWGAYYSAEKQAVWNKRSLEPSIRRDMCEDCTLAYQYSQIKEDRCRPDPSAITPLQRFASIIGGSGDPVAERERKSRAAPWPDGDDE